MKFVIIQEISFELADKVKTIVKDKEKISIKFFEKGVSKPLKPKSMPLNTFICSTVL